MQSAALLCLLQQKKTFIGNGIPIATSQWCYTKRSKKTVARMGARRSTSRTVSVWDCPPSTTFPLRCSSRNSSQQDRLCPRHTILGPQLLRCQQLAVMPPSSAQSAHSTPQHGRAPHSNPQVSSKATPSMCQDPQRISSRAIKQHTTCKQHSTAATHTGMHTVSRKARIGRDGTPQRRAAVTPPSCTRHAHSTSQ